MTQVIRQLFRFGVVGMLSNAVGYLFYLGMTFAGMEPKFTMTLLYFVGVAQTFFFNQRWTFSHNGHSGRIFWRYLAVYSAGYVFNLTLLLMFVDVLGFPHQLVQCVAIVILAVGLFLLQKHWVFSRGRECHGY